MTSSRIKIVEIFPRTTRKELFLHKRCYLGISIGNPNFRPEALRILLHWIGQHFEECLIVVGDYLQRYNEHIFYNRQAREAEIESLRLGDTFLAESEAALSSLPKSKFHIARWKEFLDDPHFVSAKQTLEALFLSSFEFRESIERTSADLILRQMKIKNAPVVDKKAAIALSTQYLLEEIAVFSALVERGWSVEVYPGSEIPVLADIARGKFSPIPEPLKRRINVEVRVR